MGLAGFDGLDGLPSLRVLDGLSDGIIATDEAGLVRYVNPAAERLLGWSSTSVHGRPLEALLPRRPRPRGELDDGTYPDSDGGLPSIGGRTRVAAIRPDSTEVEVELTVSAFRLPDGQVLRVAALRDLHERIELENERLARGHLTFLARAGALLDVSLDYATTLANVARLAVPELADYCLVDVLDDAGRMQRVATAHRDVTREPLLRTTEQRHLADASHPAMRALRSGKAVIETGITPAVWEKIAKDERHLEVLRALGPHSWVFVPMIARQKPIGAIALVLTTEGRAFTPAEIALAQEVGTRAALAVDNAHLYQAAEAQRARLYSLFMQAPAAIAILKGADHRFELSNPMHQRMANDRDLLGKPASEALPELTEQGLGRLLDEVFRTGATVRGAEVAVPVPDTDGTMQERFITGVYEPLRDDAGAVEGVMVFAYDVTDQVVARRKVEILAGELEKAVRVRDEFLSIAGHELRTPLTTLKLQLDSLHRQVQRPNEDLTSERLRERIAKGVAQVDRLERLIRELLDVTRITAGRIAFALEELDLSQLLRDVVERFADEAERVGSTIALPRTDALLGTWDRMGIDQVVSNLLNNAVKYGAGKPIEVVLEATDDVASIRVIDRGIGIAPDDQERLFGRFERAVSDRNYGGLGLGLWIAKQIVDAHGGTIAFSSELDEGTTFVVSLPRRPPRRPPP